MWQDFHFLRPEWFWLLAPLAILLWSMVRYSKQASGWKHVIAPHLIKVILPSAAKSAHKNTLIVLTALVGLLGITAGAGPTFERLPQPVFSVNQGHVVVMDMSLSMRATDITPDRLTRAKFKAIDLVKAINEGEIGLVAYAGDAFVISPLTEDIATLETLLPSLRPEIMPSPGSDALSGLMQASELLTQAGYPQGAVYWITDGIEPSDVAEIREWLSSTQLTVNILAIGTEQGAPIKQLSGELLKDSRGNIVIPRMNQSRLQPLARQTGGVATAITADDADIQQLVSSNKIQNAEKSPEESIVMNGDQWFELGPYVVVLMLPLVLYLFRRGMLAVIAVGLALPLLTPTPAMADTNWRNWFKNADQQGLQAYQNEDFANAANTFKDSMWKGSALYKEGNYEAALEAFSQTDTAQSWYNRGNTLAQMQQLDDAIAAYEEALKRQPDFSQAEQNKALLEQLKQQQEQQEQQQDQNGQNQQQQDDQQQGDQQQGDNSDAEQQQDDQQQSQQSQQSDQNGQQQDSEQQNQQEQQSEQSQEEDPSQEQEQAQQQQSQAEQQEQEQEQQASQMQPGDVEMTDEEREKQQQMEALLRRIPNDPAFLLQRKMLLEAQQRNRQRLPAGQEKTW